jgi:hypothetical protein
MYVKYANLRYEKIKNFRNVKWTEDINKGAVLEAHVSKIMNSSVRGQRIR